MEVKEEFLKERVYKNHEFLRKKALGILQLISSLPPNFSVIVNDGKLDADFGGVAYIRAMPTSLVSLRCRLLRKNLRGCFQT